MAYSCGHLNSYAIYCEHCVARQVEQVARWALEQAAQAAQKMSCATLATKIANEIRRYAGALTCTANDKGVIDTRIKLES